MCPFCYGAIRAVICGFMPKLVGRKITFNFSDWIRSARFGLARWRTSGRPRSSRMNFIGTLWFAFWLGIGQLPAPLNTITGGLSPS